MKFNSSRNGKPGDAQLVSNLISPAAQDLILGYTALSHFFGLPFCSWESSFPTCVVSPHLPWVPAPLVWGKKKTN